MRPLDHVPVHLGERHERHRPPIVDVGALDRDLLGGLLLHHLEDVLRARRPTGNTTKPPVLRQRQRDVVDALRDDDLVERTASGTSRLLKNAHFVFARDGGNWLNFEEAVVEQA
jgi:hypothetical protein